MITKANILKKLRLVLILSVVFFVVMFSNSNLLITNASNIKSSDKLIKTDSGEYVSKDSLATNFNADKKYDRKQIDDLLQKLNKVQLSSVTTKSDNLLRSTALLATQGYEYSKPYGAAWSYEATSSTSYNCYGYASRFYQFINPGDIAYYNGSPIGQGKKASVDEIASWVIRDLERAGRPARIISSSSAYINNYEYRIAVRVGNQRGVYDYHFMLQTSDGGWCHKPGSMPSQYLGKIEPASYSWNLRNNNGSIAISNFYNSKTIFIAVKK